MITFRSDAQLVTGVGAHCCIQAPPLRADGVTQLDQAFQVLLESLDRDITRAQKEAKGDWKPAVLS